METPRIFKHEQKALNFVFSYNAPGNWSPQKTSEQTVAFRLTSLGVDSEKPDDLVTLFVFPLQNENSPHSFTIKEKKKQNIFKVSFSFVQIKEKKTEGLILGEGDQRVLVYLQGAASKLPDAFSNVLDEISKSFRYRTKEGPGEKVLLKRGGFFSRLFNRTKIREYSEKIYLRQITYSELRDYLEKGGSPNTLSYYGTPFMDPIELPLLNSFIEGATLFNFPGHTFWEQDTRDDLLKCLKLLLDNGADPNFTPDDLMREKASSLPLLFASWVGDTGAIDLLTSYGAQINAIQKIYSDFFGPPLLAARNESVFDFILTKNPDPYVLTPDGLNIVQQLVFSTDYSPHRPSEIIRRLRWYEAKGLRFKWVADSDDPIARARWLQRHFEPGPNSEPDVERAKLWQEIGDILKRLRAD